MILRVMAPPPRTGRITTVSWPCIACGIVGPAGDFSSVRRTCCLLRRRTPGASHMPWEAEVPLFGGSRIRFFGRSGFGRFGFGRSRLLLCGRDDRLFDRAEDRLRGVVHVDAHAVAAAEGGLGRIGAVALQRLFFP